jgi:hypothetical protein
MNQYISFYDSTGKITGMAGVEEAILPMIKEHTQAPFVDGAWLDMPVYVLNGEVVNRPENPTTISGFVLSNVPVPSTIKINSVSYEASESEIELSFNLPGTYAVTVSTWPYLDKEFQVENPA